MRFKATKVGAETTLSRIIKLIEDAQTKKAPIQRFADLVSAYFVPIVISIALLTFIIWYFIVDKEFSFALITTIAVLVIACPCALGLATPTALMVGSGMGAKRGILIRKGEAIQTMREIKTVVFDKTGTITKGKPEVMEIYGRNEKQLMEIAASLEKLSEHPIAKTIVQKAELK